MAFAFTSGLECRQVDYLNDAHDIFLNTVHFHGNFGINEVAGMIEASFIFFA